MGGGPKRGSLGASGDRSGLGQDFLETRTAHHYFKVPFSNPNLGCGFLNLSHFLAALGGDRKWGQNRAFLSAIRARRDVRLGRWEIDPDLARIFWKSGPLIAISRYPFQTLIGDKDCSIFPIFTHPGRGTEMG